MIYTDLTKKALRIAFDAHRDQVDRAGLPYVFHPFHLAEQMADEVSVAAALLHDAVEDTPLTFEALALQGIPGAVLDIVRLLTHEDGVPYMDYVHRIKDSGDRRAISIKLADLRHNSDPARLDSVGEADLARFEKYRAAVELLEG